MNNGCKIILFFLFLFASVQNVLAQADEDHKIRLELQYARSDEQLSNQLYQQLTTKVTNDVTWLNYKATSCLLQGLHSDNIMQQNKYISEALSHIDKALSLESTNIEAHVLRVAIESSLPFFTFKRKHLQEDAHFLKLHFNRKNFKVYSFRTVEEMYFIIEESRQFTKSELVQMKIEVALFQKELASIDAFIFCRS